MFDPSILKDPLKEQNIADANLEFLKHEMKTFKSKELNNN